MTKGHSKLETLIQNYPEVFQSGLEAMKSFRAHLHLKEGTHPKFCRPRAVPFAIKESVERERSWHCDQRELQWMGCYCSFCLKTRWFHPCVWGF